jgi:hypothetical protein
MTIPAAVGAGRGKELGDHEECSASGPGNSQRIRVPELKALFWLDSTQNHQFCASQIGSTKGLEQHISAGLVHNCGDQSRARCRTARSAPQSGMRLDSYGPVGMPTKGLTVSHDLDSQSHPSPDRYPLDEADPRGQLMLRNASELIADLPRRSVAWLTSAS